MEWPFENPLACGMKAEGTALNLALLGPSSNDGCIDRNVAETPHGAELFAFRFSGCLDKQGSLFLLRPEWAEPQGWKIKRGQRRKKFFLNLDFPVSYWLPLRILFVPKAMSFHPAVWRILSLERSAYFHYPLSFLFHQKLKQIIITTTSIITQKLNRPSLKISKQKFKTTVPFCLGTWVQAP